MEEHGRTASPMMIYRVSAVPRYDTLAIIRDWNAKVGKDYKTRGGIIGKYGTGEPNEKGYCPLNFCATNNLPVVNTFFEKRQNK